MNKTSESYMTKREAAIRLQVSEKTVSRMIERGQLDAIKIGTLVRIPRTSFDKLSQGGSHE